VEHAPRQEPSKPAPAREGSRPGPPSETRLERQLYLTGGLIVVATTAVCLVRVVQVSGWEGLSELGQLAATSMLLLGKFVIFVGLHEDALSPWGLALLVWMIDLLVAFALASGLESFERTPVLGRWLLRARLRAVEVVRTYPRLERMAFFGVALFVLLPLAATGAVSGSFAARLLGLSRISGVLAIALGSLGTAITFALLAEFLGERAAELLRSPVMTGALIVVAVVAGRWAYRRVMRALREA
jgi:uncharacterized membrane protein